MPTFHHRSLFATLALTCAIRSDAQTTFMRMYAGGNSGYAVRESTGGDLLVAGGTNTYYNWHWWQLSPIASTHAHLLRTDPDGTLQWERVYTLPGSRTIARWMEPTSDGGCILAGMSCHDTSWPPDSNDVLVIKTDALGMVAWAKTFDSGKDELGFCVRTTSDGGYIVSGFHDTAPISLVGSTYALLIKMDALGNTQWVKEYPLACRDLNTHEPFPYVVNQLPDDGFAIVGSTVGAHPSDVYVIRTDPTGAVLWARSYEHDASIWRNSTGQDIVGSPTGELIVAGSMDKSQPMELNHPHILRIAANGDLLEAAIFESVPAVAFQSGFSSVAPTPDGGYFFTGMGGYSGFGDNAQLLKTDADLTMLWSRVYTMDGAATMGARSGRPTSDGGYVFTGKRQFSGTVLLKTDAQGLVACKTPMLLTSIDPQVNTVVRDPVPMNGMPASNALLSTISPSVDTTTLCPLSQVLLPIALGELTATLLPDDRVLAEWITYTESDNAWFVVQRSGEGIEFTDIGTLPGAGSSVHATRYAYLDEAPLPQPVSYYRLEQIDADGSVSLSNVVAVTHEPSALRLLSSAWDPATDRYIVHVADDREEPAALTLTDALGRQVLQRSFTTERGHATWSFALPSAASGVLNLQVACGERRVLGRVVR